MADYRGYLVPPCPTCGASDLVKILAPADPRRQFGPGEWAIFKCDFCGDGWKALVPEPPDVSAGIGGIPL